MANKIKINGERIKYLLSLQGLTPCKAEKQKGYSGSMITHAISKGEASATVQNLLSLYGINPEQYIIVESEKEEPEEQRQITFDDIETIKKDEIKALVKEALTEVFTAIECKTLNVQYDTIRHRYIATLFIEKGE